MSVLCVSSGMKPEFCRGTYIAVRKPHEALLSL
jgi:hypothetical protein